MWFLGKLWFLGIIFLFFAFVFVWGARDENTYTLFGFKTPRFVLWIFAIYCVVAGVGLLFFS